MQSVTKSLIPTLLIAIPLIASKIAMFDIDIVIIKKNIKKKSHLQVINVLKKSIRVITITKQILNLIIGFTFGKLLASALAMENKFIKAIFEDKNIKFCVNTFDLRKV